jgi:hypothetical protein
MFRSMSRVSGSDSEFGWHPEAPMGPGEILLALPKRYITEKMTWSVNNHLKVLTSYSN